MRAVAWSGRALAWAALALTGAATAGPRGAAPPDAAPVEIELAAVVPVDAEIASVLVLREKNGSTVLPIFVGKSEASAIDRQLKEGPDGTGAGDGGARIPSRADLLGRLVGALGGQVVRVEIQVRQRELFKGLVTLLQGGRRLTVEARPSESVALALAYRAPIYATREVLDRAGLTPQDVARMRRDARVADEEEAALGPEQRF